MAFIRKLDVVEEVKDNRDLMKTARDFLSFHERSRTNPVSKFFNNLDKEYDEQEVQKLRTKNGAELSSLGVANEKTAILILKTTELLNKLGSYRSNLAYDDSVISISPYENGMLLLKLGLAHVSTTHYILNHEHIKRKLSINQILQLEDKLLAKDFVVTRMSCIE